MPLKEIPSSSELVREDYNWTEKIVIGTALLLMGGSIDSFGDSIKADIFYEVGKHKENGLTAILPTEKNQRHDFINSVMKRKNKFN